MSVTSGSRTTCPYKQRRPLFAENSGSFRAADVPHFKKRTGQRFILTIMKLPAVQIAFLVCSILQCASQDSLEPCQHYRVLDDPWRATTNELPSVVKPKCDKKTPFEGWYRMFLNGQNARLPEQCVPKRHCGTHAPAWMNGSHPRPEDGIVSRPVCAAWGGNCCRFRNGAIQVKACPGGYYVYRLVKLLYCQLAYCAESIPAPRSVEMDITCLENSIHIALNQSGSVELQARYLRLGEFNCSLSSNGTHLLASTPLDGCDTQMEDDGENLIFSNEIVSYGHSNATIVRHPLVDIAFSCKYPKRNNVTTEFRGHRPPVNFTQMGFGSCTLQFEFFDSKAFTRAKDPNSYPLTFTLGEMMYMQIESFTMIPNTRLIAESCVATPSNDHEDPRSYPIILHGCAVDQTVEIIANGNSSQVQFAMKAFKFMGLFDKVFISCSVVLCKADASGSRCSQGCIQQAKREASILTSAVHNIQSRERILHPVGYITSISRAGPSIRKREAPIQTSNRFISQGPIQLKDSVTKASPGHTH